jgi:hypothetical protein
MDMDMIGEGQDETQSVASENNNTNKKSMSGVWNFFEKIGKDINGIERAECNFCKNHFAIKQNPKSLKNYGTSHLMRHVVNCKIILSKLNSLEQPFSMTEINQKTHRSLLSEAIVAHDLPFSFVEYGKIREWVKYLNPSAEMVCRNTEVSDIEKIYDRERMKLKDIMARIPNRICLTSDLWTATTSEGYICLTAHFVDENWKLVSCVLNFCRMKPPHTGIALETALFDCLKQWGIDKKIFSITLDNASANDNMKDHLKNHLRVQSNLMGNGEFFHVRCSAHILNLIVQEGLKVASEALYKIRESVKYIKSSDGRMVKFNDCVSDAGLSVSTGLRLDVSTRWNTGYFMLESALQYRKAFEIFQVADRNFKHCPSDEEWERAERICEFLEPFYDITNLISGSNYPTANLYFMQVWKVQCLLEKHKVSDDKVIRDMSLDMMVKFEKYWTNYSVVLAFGAILDPRLKVKFLKYCYTKLDALTAEAKLGNLMRKFKRLYEEYVKYFANQNISLSQSSYESISLSNPSRSSQGNKTKKSKFTSVSFLC